MFSRELFVSEKRQWHCDIVLSSQSNNIRKKHKRAPLLVIIGYLKYLKIYETLLGYFLIGQIISILEVLGADRNVSGKLGMKLPLC